MLSSFPPFRAKANFLCAAESALTHQPLSRALTQISVSGQVHPDSDISQRVTCTGRQLRTFSGNDDDLLRCETACWV